MKNFTFYNFLELIKEYSIFNTHIDIVNQVLKGNYSLRNSDFYDNRNINSYYNDISPRKKIYIDYLGVKAPDRCKKIEYMKGLKLKDNLISGNHLLQILINHEYYLPENIKHEINDENDIYVALVILLEAVMNNKGIISAHTNGFENGQTIDYHGELRRAIDKQGKNEPYNLNIFKVPLGWYINQIINHTETNNTKLAERVSMSQQIFIKKTDPNNMHPCDLYLTDLKKICNSLNVSIASILYCYENREYFEGNPREINNFCHLFPNYTVPSNYMLKTETCNNLIINSKNSYFKKWLNKSFYCYFSSTNSDEAKDEKKNKANVDHRSQEYSDLYELFSDDHIYGGILTFEERENVFDASISQCIATIRFMVDPKKNHIKEYSGPVIISETDNKHALFIQLYYDDEITFMILNNPQDTSVCLIAEILTLSSKSKTSSRMPCVERMIMSEKKLLPGSVAYNYMKSHLRMHDSFIRIDTEGYNFLIQELKTLNSDDAKVLLKNYGNLHALKKLGNNGNPVAINELAYIKDWMVDKSNLTLEQRTLFETMLRSHSIAPWYSKVNNSQLKELENIIKQDFI